MWRNHYYEKNIEIVLFVLFFLLFLHRQTSEALTGFCGWVTKHIKGVELTSYLRHTESGKFKIFRTVRLWSMSIGWYMYIVMLFLAFLYIGIQIPMIYTTAWASALLILGRWQYQSQVCGMSDVFRFPRFLFSSFYVCADRKSVV